MWDDELKAPHTAHTSNSVPIVLCDDRYVDRQLSRGALCDVSPTILDLLEIPKAAEMAGKPLLVK